MCDLLTSNGLLLLGIALHPIQDKYGHLDYFYELSTCLLKSVAPGWNADQVGYSYEIILYGDKTMVYEHFDDVIKTRDVTYGLLGRFFKEYNNLIMRI